MSTIPVKRDKPISRNGYARLLGDCLSTMPLEEAQQIIGVLGSQMYRGHEANALGYSLLKKNTPLFLVMMYNYIKTNNVLGKSSKS